MKLSLALELNNQYQDAVEVYDEIIEEYPRSSELTDAKKLKALAEEKAR
ncbi:MAG: hypothetical protein HC880_14690 [Bacteroidia bacterium]|nr:hypothetical protein [Bacteroidia bacterium]